ncbi:asparagine synthase-related protein [Prosthecochloris vibrioformis]|uniref:asparagine synthase (glutamine-hydrolyzing) n=1 Tax=Prosthecochloris vibrioformis TaxID=1098 RepID=A0A5C4S2S1_PROVB|nr:asparagine synthase-related protein [Prosthecochloris vibrioformis]TNJ37432.1 hypothetical protein FGF68_04290 [Prosthecochloris vibrioformis]
MIENVKERQVVGKQKLIFESDWLASTPVFYNQKLGIASTSIHDVMPPAHELSFHPEGLYNYLDFGYSVFEQTPILDVQFLPSSSRIYKKPDGSLMVKKLDDPIEKWWDYRLSEDDVVELIRARVHEWEEQLPSDQEIVLPLSGGFDSRFLLWCIKDKSRVRAYTYGISQSQSDSAEVVHARELARMFGLRWEQIPMGEQHHFFDEWDELFGVSTHAHGMYHFEFYSKIRKKLKGDHAFLSGIHGDRWAGSIPLRSIKSANDLELLSYSHGLRADVRRQRLNASHSLRQQFWKNYCNRLDEHRMQLIYGARFKEILLSYLMRVPRRFGFNSWSPFLDIDIAMSMLNLPPHRRNKRKWQQDFFRKVGLNLEEKGLQSSRQNNLNYQAVKQVPLAPLDENLLGSVVDKQYVQWINRHVKLSTWSDIHTAVSGVPKLGGLLRRAHLDSPFLRAYCAYLCLRPLENVLRRKG